MLHSNIGIKNTHLTFAGTDTTILAEKYGTPLYLLDEDRIRENCRAYTQAFSSCFGDGSYPLYAGKALCFKGIYGIINEENMGIDVVSPGELYTAAAAGFPMEKAYFHGNNKTDEDIAYAMDYKVGYIIADSLEELRAINSEAEKRGIIQNILLRVTPGIDPHTHAKITTGTVDSKFGFAVETGAAAETARFALTLKNLSMNGFHCHIGSQIFSVAPFIDALDVMLGFMADFKEKTGYKTEILNLGGGFGVRYVEKDCGIDIREAIRLISVALKMKCKNLSLDVPDIRMEPGRSIVADAGMTLYTAGSVKEIKGCKNYVSIDGGMTDNPRFALYQSEYTVYNASRANEKADYVCSVVGRCCESGDIIQENVSIPKPERGDIIAVAVTGAYNYSMASNYNRLPRPAMVKLSGGKDRLTVKRESYEDLLRNEI